MSSIRFRIVLLMIGSLASLIGLGWLTWTSFLKIEANLDRLSFSKDQITFLNSLPRQSYDKNKLVQLQNFYKSLKEKDRQKGMEEIIFAYANFQEKKLIQSIKKVEQIEFFYRNQYEVALLDAKSETRKNFIFSFLTTLFFLLLLYLFTLRSIFIPLQKLTKKMNDFLHHQYVYTIESPSDTEVGLLHETFNSLAQQSLQNYEDLKKLDQAKTEFLNIASHELRTPLTSIKGSLSLLKMSLGHTTNPQVHPLIKIAEEETDRLIRLINDILDLAKIEAGNMPLHKDWIPIESLILKCFNGLMGLSQAAQIKLKKELLQSSIAIYADEDRIHQVLTNLISNAIKFSPPGEEVLVKLTIQEDQLLIQVIDKGKGISETDQKRLFLKFSQASNEKNPLVKGTGLGLAIAKAIIDQHQGSIGVTSQPGIGSEFFFSLKDWKKLKNDLNDSSDDNKKTTKTLLNI